MSKKNDPHIYDMWAKDNKKNDEKIIANEVIDVHTYTKSPISNFGNCCGAMAVYPSDMKDENIVGIRACIGIVGEEKRHGKHRIYHVKTSNGDLTIDLLTSMSQEDRDRFDRMAYEDW